MLAEKELEFVRLVSATGPKTVPLKTSVFFLCGRVKRGGVGYNVLWQQLSIMFLVLCY